MTILLSHNQNLRNRETSREQTMAAAAGGGGGVKLYGTWSSHYVLRVKWALRLKGIEFEYIEEDLSNKSSALIAYNPIHKKVPVLVHGDKAIAESLTIIEYIDETWKDRRPILPRDPRERAMARFWSKSGDEKVQPYKYYSTIFPLICIQIFSHTYITVVEFVSSCYAEQKMAFLLLQLSPSVWRVLITEGQEQEEAHATATENLEILEDELRGKKFFGGNTIGLTDLVLGGMAYGNGLYEEITRLKLIDKERFPLLSVWMEDFSNSRIVEGTFPPKDELLFRLSKLRETSSHGDCSSFLDLHFLTISTKAYCVESS